MCNDRHVLSFQSHLGSNKTRQVLGPVLAFALLGSFANADGNVSDALRKHAQTIDAIRSYHLTIEYWSSRDDEVGGDLVHEKTTEIWQSGTRRRWIDRVFHSLGQEGLVDHGEHGEVFEYSVNGSLTRTMSGWDAEHPPFPVPLEFGRSPRELHEVRCTIQATDPVAFEKVVEEDRAIMRWDLLPGYSLAQTAEVCKLSVVPQPNPSVTRLKIESTTAPHVLVHSRLTWGPLSIWIMITGR